MPKVHVNTLDDAASFIASRSPKPTKVVLVTGVFDLLHQEHRIFLQKAKAVGDFLIVGIETDQRVRQLKGEGRPVNPLEIRLANVDSLHLADIVFALPEKFSKSQDHENLIATLRPHILAVSSHTKHLTKKQQLMIKYDGQLIIVHPHNPAVSSTKLINQGELLT